MADDDTALARKLITEKRALIALIIGKSDEATKKQLARLLRRLQQHYHRQEEEWWQLDRRDVVCIKSFRLHAHKSSRISNTELQNSHISAA